MNEELIAKLDELGVSYDETDGTIDIADIDKSTLIEIISYLNDNAITFSIDDSAITVTSTEVPEEAPEDTTETSAMDEALSQYGTNSTY